MGYFPLTLLINGVISPFAAGFIWALYLRPHMMRDWPVIAIALCLLPWIRMYLDNMIELFQKEAFLPLLIFTLSDFGLSLLGALTAARVVAARQAKHGASS